MVGDGPEGDGDEDTLSSVLQEEQLARVSAELVHVPAAGVCKRVVCNQSWSQFVEGS